MYTVWQTILALNGDVILSDSRAVARSTSPRSTLSSSGSRLSDDGASLIRWQHGFSEHLRSGDARHCAAQRVKGTDEVQLQFNYVGHSHESRSNLYRPTNVGFGLTYCLPILVACPGGTPRRSSFARKPRSASSPARTNGIRRIAFICCRRRRPIGCRNP